MGQFRPTAWTRAGTHLAAKTSIRTSDMKQMPWVLKSLVAAQLCCYVVLAGAQATRQWRSATPQWLALPQLSLLTSQLCKQAKSTQTRMSASCQ